jgi:hypothetical protein
MPIDLSSLAELGVAPSASSIAAPASEIVFNMSILPGLFSPSATADQLP